MTQGRSQVSATEIAGLERSFYHAHLYLVQNRFADFHLYYTGAGGEAAEHADSMLPACLLPQNPGQKQRNLRLQLANWEAFGADWIVPGNLDGQAERFLLSSLERLLARGTESIYMADYIKTITPADLIPWIGEAAAAEALNRLVDLNFLYADGRMGKRQWRRLQELSETQWQTLRISNQPEFRSQILSAPARPYPEFQRGDGLFIYGRDGVRYCPFLNRGEHQVFLEAQVGIRYGVFGPYSFLGLFARDEDGLAGSQNIFALLQSRGILNAQGYLQNGKLAQLASADLPGRYQPLLELLAQAHLPTRDSLLEGIARGGQRLQSGLAEIGLSLAEAQALLQTMAEETLQTFLHFYQEQEIIREVAELVQEKRGIVLGDDQQRFLLLLTDPVLLAGPFYSLLLEHFRRVLQSDQVFLAHAYLRPPPRGEQTYHTLPLVEALRTHLALT